MATKFANSCCTCDSESVMNLHYIVIEQMQFFYVCLRKYIYKVRSRTPDANHSYDFFLDT